MQTSYSEVSRSPHTSSLHRDVAHVLKQVDTFSGCESDQVSVERAVNAYSEEAGVLCMSDQ